MSKFHRPCELWGKEFNVTPFTRVVLVKTETRNWLTIYDKDDALEVSSKLIESDQELEELILEAKYTIAEALNAEIRLAKEVLSALPKTAKLSYEDLEVSYLEHGTKYDPQGGWFASQGYSVSGYPIPLAEQGVTEVRAANFEALKVLYQFDLYGQKPL